VDHESGNAGNAPAVRDRDVNRRARRIGQLGKLGSRVIAQHGARAGPQYGGPQRGRASRLAGEHGIDASMYALPAALPDPRPYDVLGQAALTCLASGQHSLLKLR
jgi:hypothetical protein